ncbi:methyltransferase domain-containing protein [Actinoplanes sp. NPDC024001]|uniref:class I SAM-dependent methyltransferase n=1 Tax=Actinoplanes sp. NPDC024001 TaxID=3154598 RepID=UPI0034022AA3
MSHRDLIRQEFARQAGTFEDARLNTAFTSHLERLVDFTEPAADDVCLDVACGTGLVARALAARTRHVTALDLTPEMLATGKASADADGVRNVVFQEGDATRLPFLDASFSLVVSRFSLHQADEPQRLVAEMRRVCRPDGRVRVLRRAAGLARAVPHAGRCRGPYRGRVAGRAGRRPADGHAPAARRRRPLVHPDLGPPARQHRHTVGFTRGLRAAATWVTTPGR